MILEDIKDQFKERTQHLWSQLQESSLFLSVSEKYQDLNSAQQRIVKIVAVGVGLFIVLSVPLSYLSSSSEQVDTFEAKRNKIRDLFRVNHEVSQMPMQPRPLGVTFLESQVKSKLAKIGIPLERLKSVQELKQTIRQNGVNIEVVGASLNFSILNLTQVVDISYVLQNEDKSLKMIGLDMTPTPNEAGHYFDVTLKFAQFIVPMEAEPVSDKIKGSSKKPSKK